MSKRLYEFRISKYNPFLRLNDTYIEDEWTSISDIGKFYKGREFTKDEYIKVEEKYLAFIRLVCNQEKVSKMCICNLEDYSGQSPYSNGSVLCSFNEIVDVARNCLREKYWCKLESETVAFHFGYDFYMYVSSPLDYSMIGMFAECVGLFVEDVCSPYFKRKP